jgi:hypothetical protein
MALLTELAHKAAAAEKTEKQLSMVRETAERVMNNIETSKLKGIDYEKQPGSRVHANGNN